MIRCLLFAFGILCALAAPSAAQVCSTPAPGDSTSRCASTAFVTPAISQAVTAAQWCLNITSSAFGGAGNNSTDNTTPLNNALAALTGTGGCVYFPPGKYKFNSNLTYSFPAGVFSVTILGAGEDATILTWPSTSGIQFNYSGITNLVHIRDVSFTTGTTNAGYAVALNLTTAVANPATFAASDFYHVTIRGDDGYAQTDYWTIGIEILNVSNTQLNDVSISGASTPNGVGVLVQGAPGVSSYSTGTAIEEAVFNGLATGVSYSSFTQGVTIDQSSFTNTITGVGSAVSQTGNLTQLAVSNSQFNGQAVVSTGILTNTAIDAVQLSNNLFLINVAGSVGVNMPLAKMLAITGNVFQVNTSGANQQGIGVANTNSLPCAINGNIFEGFSGTSGVGLALGASASGCIVGNNSFLSNTTNITNSGTGNVIVNNPGYNPVGITAATSTGTTGSTITAGASPETHYIKQSATFNAAVTKGGQAICTVPSATVPCVIELGPNESYSVAWVTTQPTYTKDVH